MVTLTLPKLDKLKLIEHLLKIDNKQGLVVPFKFNKVQAYFNTHKGYRNIILKARQLGMSSSILGNMFVDCITIPHTNCAVVSHETRATQRLLDRVQFYYDSMEEPRPKIGAESRSEKTFPDLHSSMYVGTAGARAFGRGDTIREALLSEIAFYEDGEKLLSGIEDSVPLTGELTLESTANGEGNIFHKTWVLAREGKSPYKPFFFPWWWDEEYTIPRNCQDQKLLELLPPSDRNELVYTEEEKELVTRANLDEGQVRWRRFKINEKKGLFWIEYPENEVDCFITTGDPVFDQKMLTDFANQCYDGKRHEGGWTYWIPPEDKLLYFIGVDTSSGAPEGSYSAFVVINSRWEVCATFQARVEPHILAEILRKAGKWYNNAELIIERNFTGYAVLEHLSTYSHIAYQRDFATGKVTTQKGWWSNDQTRSLIMSVTKENLGQIKMWDTNLVRQLRSYRYMKLKTKYREEAQTFDDLAIALMLAVTNRKVSGTARGYQGHTPGWNW
jgi:hypothetical protein